MSIEVTVRHIEIEKEMHDYAREQAEELLESFPRVEYIHVIIDGEKHYQMAEVLVQGKNHLRAEASESTDSLKASLDKAFDKVEKQLRKSRDKVQSKRKARSGKSDTVEV
ncbi:ribosomal subunit interface protein [bacterium E08(2017)]|nr:ribosomal subunit interface protein [bacterium E08(2017)]